MTEQSQPENKPNPKESGLFKMEIVQLPHYLIPKIQTQGYKPPTYQSKSSTGEHDLSSFNDEALS